MADVAVTSGNVEGNVQVVEESDEEGESTEEENDTDNRGETDHTRNNMRTEVTEQQTGEDPDPPAQRQQDGHNGTPCRRLPNLALAALQRMRANERINESPDDFRPLKRRKTSTNGGSTATGGSDNKETDDDNEVDEGQCCSICFEPWSNSGIHRIASLKCGHLFGYNCIEKWLRAQDGRCPQCNAKAKKKDIRVIFAKSISVVDTTERDRALKEVEEEKALRISAQKSEAQVLLQYQLAKAECDRVKNELKDLRKQLEEYSANGIGSGLPLEQVSGAGSHSSAAHSANPLSNDGRFEFVKAFNINGDSRVMASEFNLDMIVASKRSTNQLFSGFGLVKISLLDLRSSSFVPIHNDMIRDVLFSPRGDGLTLTTGMDKTLKLTSMHSNTVVQSYQLPVPSWACTWNDDDPNYVYCGLSNGTVMTFDLRQTSSHLNELKLPTKRVPISSLSYVPLCRASCLNCCGLLTGTLDGVVFWEKDKDDYKLNTFDSLPGSCVNVSFENASRHCLASFRPSVRDQKPKSKHIVCQLQNTPITEPLVCNPLHQFYGGPTYNIMSRSLLFQKPCTPGKLMVAYGNEQSNTVHICDFSSTSEVQLLKTGKEPCKDILLVGGGATDDSSPLLNLLTDSKLHIYKWTAIH